MEQAIELLKALVGVDPYQDDDYGNTDCFYCASDKGQPHADDCPYARAKAYLDSSARAIGLIRGLIRAWPPHAANRYGDTACYYCGAESRQHDSNCPWEKLKMYLDEVSGIRAA